MAQLAGNPAGTSHSAGLTPPWYRRPAATGSYFVFCGLLATPAASLLAPGGWWTLVAAALYALAVRQLLRSDTRLAVLLSPFIALHAAMLLSLIAIDNGARMPEIGAIGRPSEAGPIYAILAMLFLISATVVWRRLAPPLPKREPAAHGRFPLWLEWAGLAMCLGATLWMLQAGMRTGFPLLTGTDRLLYRAQFADVLTLNFLNLKHVLAVAAGIGAAFARSPSARVAHHLAFAIFLATTLLFGDKFFTIGISTLFHVMPLALTHPGVLRRNFTRLVPVAVGLLVVMIGATTYIYSDGGRRSTEDTAHRLADRVAGQAQLWFTAVNDKPQWLTFDGRAVMLNLESAVVNPSSGFLFEQRLAGFHFIEHYSPTNMYRSFVRNAGTVTPTMIFEAYSLTLFGWIGLFVVMPLMGAFAGAVLVFLARAVSTGNVVASLLPAYLLLQTTILMAQATLYNVVSISALKAYAAFLALHVVVLGILRLRGLRTR